MHKDRPSATAWRVALRRAAHQLIDAPVVFHDPIAIPLVGQPAVDEFIAREAAASAPQQILSRALRAFVVARSRFAEEQLAEAVNRGTRQYVLLGAGLDTFALRNPFATAGLRVFEVDHPATQGWKRELLAAAGMPTPNHLTFVPTNFETQRLADTLAAAGFSNGEPAVFAWLGVVPYLTREAFCATLHYLGSGRPGNAVVFDHAVPPDQSDARAVALFESLSRRVAAVGEPFRLFLADAEMDAVLREHGFDSVTRLDALAINALYFQNRADGLHVGGGVARLTRATVDGT